MNSERFMYNEEDIIDIPPEDIKIVENSSCFIDNGILYRYYDIDKTIKIPDGVTKIKKDAFNSKNNHKIKRINLPSTVTEIVDGTSSNLTSLEEINIPNGITKIENNLFCNCRNLKKINLPDKVIKIGDNAFCCCFSLKEINIPDSIEEIGISAFFLCISLDEKIFNFSKRLKKIGENAFAHTKTRIAIFNNCEIGKDAFLACKELIRKEI